VYVGISFFSQILPIIFPSLIKIPPPLLLKVILLLTLSFILLSVLALNLWFKAQPHKPFSKKGKFANLNWWASIEYRENGTVFIAITFYCPIHSCTIDSKGNFFFCAKCNKLIPVKYKKHDMSYPDVEQIIRHQIKSQINLINAS